MAVIKKLKLKLRSSLLSELQSDTIFGHFAWRFKDEYGEEKLARFLPPFTEGNPIFTISDGFLEKNEEVFFPKPLKPLPPIFATENKTARLKNSITRKENQSRKQITLKPLNFYLQGYLKSFAELLAEMDMKDIPHFKQKLRMNVEIDRGNFQANEEKLFSFNFRYLDEDTFIDIFVKILNQEKWEEYGCENILKSIFKIGYGKKKSSGYGRFEIVSFTDFEQFEESGTPNGFINLSHYLPANRDKIKDAYYDINVKYGKFGEEKSNQNPFKPPMLLMKPGGCFITDVKSDFFGRAANNLSPHIPNAIHNGIAFTLNCNFEVDS